VDKTLLLKPPTSPTADLEAETTTIERRSMEPHSTNHGPRSLAGASYWVNPRLTQRERERERERKREKERKRESE
jgi:hypothetical protein